MPERRPRLGYAMVLAAATLFAVNGVVSKVILASGISSIRLAQVRTTGAALALLGVVALVRRGALRVSRRELPFLAFFGVCGLALVQWFYFLAIHRLAVAIALLIQYLAPLLVALWARFAVHEPVRRRIWLARPSPPPAPPPLGGGGSRAAPPHGQRGRPLGRSAP